MDGGENAVSGWVWRRKEVAAARGLRTARAGELEARLGRELGFAGEAHGGGVSSAGSRGQRRGSQ
jgi:hypothetical protein